MKTLKLHDIGFLERKQVLIDWLMILNQQLDEKLIGLLLPCCQKILAVDGGANRLYQLNPTIKIQAIVGDLDSLEEQTRKHYEAQNVKVELLQNQNRNDFDKAIRWIMAQEEKCRIWVVGAIGGRLDHTFQNFHTTLIALKTWPQLEICLISQENMMHGLRPHIRYRVRQANFEQKTGCSIISFDEAAITTKGLRWNLPAQIPTIKFGSFISTSNEVIADQVQLQSTQLFFWITNLKKM